MGRTYITYSSIAAFMDGAKPGSVEEREYDKKEGAFGRMPIVIHLGDFLQKKPIGGNSISLIEDLRERERKNKMPKDYPPEYQMAMKVSANRKGQTSASSSKRPTA